MNVAEFHCSVNNNKRSRHRQEKGEVENRDAEVNVNETLSSHCAYKAATLNLIKRTTITNSRELFLG